LGVSFGGHWVIGFSDYIEKQNDKIKAGQLPDAHYIHIDTAGMINGLVEFLILWWGSMVTPAGTPDFGAIVLPIPIPLLYFR
jgi:hypothetical protein